MIEVRDLTKNYGGKDAISGLCFDIEPGHIYGFLGPNGAGKSTTMNILAGVLAPSSGEVRIFGHDVESDTLAAKAHIGYLPENPPLYNDLTPSEYLRFVASAKKIPKHKIADEVSKVIDEAGIESVKNKLISTLSKGYRQRVGIAQAILGSPDVVILDEPTAGLDPKQVVEVRKLIAGLGKQRTVILSSHILSEIEEICDRILIISDGKLIENDSMETLSARYRTGNVLVLHAKCKASRAKEILAKVSGIESAVYEDLGGECTINLRCARAKDVREDVFFAFALAHTALLSMELRKVTLEDIFLRATDSDIKKPTKSTTKDTKRKGKKPIPSTVKSEKEKVSDDEDDDDGDDYRPLFTGKQ